MMRAWLPAFLLASVASVAIVAAACTSFDAADSPPSGSSSSGHPDASADASTDHAPGSHTFFDGFDDGPLGAKWTAPSVGAPVTLTVDATKSFSAPGSLLAVLPEGSGTYVAGAHLMKRFDRSTKALECGAMVFVEEHTALATPSILDVTFRIPSNAGFTSAEADLSVDDSGSSVAMAQAGAGERSSPEASVAIATGRWLPLRMVIDVDARNVTVFADGNPYLTGAFPAPVRPNEGFDVKLGLFETSDDDSAAIRFDDFYCDVAFD